MQCPNVASAREAARRMAAPAWRFALVPDEYDPGSFAANVAWACEAIYARGSVLLVVDEMDQFWPATARESPFAKPFVWGRNRGINIVATTRRPAEISRVATSQATEFSIFRTEEPRDLDWIRAYCGGPIMARVLALPSRYTYVHFDLISRESYLGRSA